jgi:hypothetical protein
MATKANIVIDQGSTFTTDVIIKDDNGFNVSLDNCVSTAQIRKWYNSSNAVSFTTTIDVDAGSINLRLEANTSAAMDFGRYVYDVEIINTTTNETTRIVEGIVTITPQVTR